MADRASVNNRSIVVSFGLEQDKLALLRTTNMTQLVVDTIRSAIVGGSIPPGSRLTESALASQLNVSKTPVREALITLRSIGIIEPDGRRGDRVVLPSADLLRNAYDAREAVEVFFASQAAELANAEQVDRIQEAAARSLEGANNGNGAMFREGDEAFHAAIRVGDNPILEKIADNIFTLILTLRQRDVPTKGVSIRCGEHHVKIGEAIRAGDVELAAQSIRDHVRYVAIDVISFLTTAEGSQPAARRPARDGDTEAGAGGTT